MGQRVFLGGATGVPGRCLLPALVGAGQASTAILRKLGFVWVDRVDHPEDGEVWEWQRGLHVAPAEAAYRCPG